MNGDAFFLQRRADFGCRRAVLGQQVLHTVDTETFTLSAGKEHVALTTLPFSKPGFQHGEGGLSKRGAAFFAALADHTQVSASPNDDIRAFEPSHFRYAQARLHRHEQKG